MARLALPVVAVVASFVASAATPPLPSSCSGTPNLLPIYSGAPVLVNKTTNGLKMKVSTPNITAPLLVLHVYGSQYEMGYAYGSLLREEITTLLPQVMAYLDAQVNASLPDWVPPQWRENITTLGVEWALDLTYNVTRPFTPSWHYDTLRGMADGAGLEYMTLARASMIPELIKASCSMMGAWGDATRNATGGALLQLRALDWDTDGPFQQYPLLVTWHPTPANGSSPGNGSPFSALTWAGMLGAITGMAASGMGVSEKVWDAYTGTQNVFGYVWNFLLQDILQFDSDLDQALSRIATANRTCSIWAGIGDARNAQFKAVAYSNQLVNIYNDRNYPAYPNHDLFPGVVFINKHVQPSSEPCMNDLVHAFYGDIDAVSTLRYITALEQTGDMHIGVYDFAKSLMYVANAAVADANGNAAPAYTQQFIQLDMAAMWNTSLADY